MLNSATRRVTIQRVANQLQHSSRGARLGLLSAGRDVDHMTVRWPSQRPVISEIWGGLGDALAFSTLPESFCLHLGRLSFLHNLYMPRNAEISQLVWGNNPYVLGWASESPNAGSVVRYRWKAGQTFIQNIETSHGLPPNHTRPKVYYVPIRDRNLSDRVLIDISKVTLSRGPFQLSSDKLSLKLEELVDTHGGANVSFVEHINLGKLQPNIGQEKPVIPDKFSRISRYPVATLFGYADALASARGLVGLHSGGVALASAMRDYNPELDIECLISADLANHPRQVVERIHNYPDVRYTPLV